MEPWVVTADEVDAENIHVKFWVNGELRQNSNTKDLLFEDKKSHPRVAFFLNANLPVIKPR